MYIKELRLVSFKGFQDFVLECSPLTILVGLNSNGKTSILQAIKFLHDIVTYAFGNEKQAAFSNIQWSSNPIRLINKTYSGDPDALWLDKRISEPCKISAKILDRYEFTLEVSNQRSYSLDLLYQGESIKNEIDNNLSHKNNIQEFYSGRPTYVPPVGMVSPTETFLHRPQFDDMINQGQFSETWRNRLYWLWNDGYKQEFDDITEIVKQFLPMSTVLKPSHTHDSPPKIRVEFEENDVRYDVSTSGGGLRSLLNLAVALQASDSKCLLLDEPESHLHGTLQRDVARMLIDYVENNNVQVFVATHAPEFMADLPVENLVWIDRNERQGVPCSDIGRFLIDLGAISSSDAIRAHGADKILFVEGNPDKRIISQLMQSSGKKNLFEDPKVIVAKLPNGKGDSKYLKHFQELLRNSFKIDVKIGCITDNDYEFDKGSINGKEINVEPLILSLSRKEIENYLIEPEVVFETLSVLAEKRYIKGQTNHESPNFEQIRNKLNEILDNLEIKGTVKIQVVPRFRETLDKSIDDSQKEKQAYEWFEEKWADYQWKISNCPGKKVLRALRTWLQDEYNITLTNNSILGQLKVCPSDIASIAEKLEQHFYN